MASSAVDPGDRRRAFFKRLLGELRTCSDDVEAAKAMLRHEVGALKDLESDHCSLNDRQHYGFAAAESVAEEDEDLESDFQKHSHLARAGEKRLAEAKAQYVVIVGKLSFETGLYRESDWQVLKKYLASKGAPVPELRESQVASLQRYPTIVEGLLEELLAQPL